MDDGRLVPGFSFFLADSTTIMSKGREDSGVDVGGDGGEGGGEGGRTTLFTGGGAGGLGSSIGFFVVVLRVVVLFVVGLRVVLVVVVGL